MQLIVMKIGDRIYEKGSYTGNYNYLEIPIGILNVSQEYMVCLLHNSPPIQGNSIDMLFSGNC